MSHLSKSSYSEYEGIIESAHRYLIDKLGYSTRPGKATYLIGSLGEGVKTSKVGGRVSKELEKLK